MEIPVRNTIFLQGVFFSQVRTVEERLIEESLNHQQHQSTSSSECRSLVDIRLSRFKNKKQWAESFKDQTLKCWYCSLNFKGVPCFIPLQIRNTSKGKEYDTYGLFCNFACAYTHLRSNAEFYRNKTFFDKLSMLKMLYSEFYNKKVDEFQEAPSIYDLNIYGGYMDYVEYRQQLKNINTSIMSSASIIKQPTP